MRFTRTKAIIATAGLALSLAACGDAGEETDGPDVEVADDAASSFDDGTRMKELADAGTINVGVKYDQPGLGFKDAASDIPTGFDVEMAKVLVASLGIDPNDTSKVKYVETISDNREPFLEDGTVDLVLASYSITDERRQVVGQAGPYLVTGQQLLVAADSDIESVADVEGEEVCSVTGSTSLDNVEAEGAKPVGFDTYSECVEKVLDGTVSAMSTDGTILAGYAAQNEGDLKVVGDEFSEERIGVGYSQDYPEMCQWIVDTITEAYDDGTYEEAFNATLGPSGVDVPELPEMDACES
ncbi:glutamate ABC transporter substrate-binding protein [Nocardioides baculatus]|jgi:glutamate transport system substrate-binding protein|uniref:Glutamate ABC transporter substrate-binding protein n=1 Tax=Nocardioides baculatus TaxID=2801337 RepID=A0ABS1LCV9_9ACTN|nr:glutamate ABC transporter substrate-binding protein [Nocardioides baculatus]MBL0749218.1 glutamate ABC transporter substrate-binding protein [Nocardioides baculatus]